MTLKQKIKKSILELQGTDKKEIYNIIYEKYGIDRKRISEYYLEVLRTPPTLDYYNPDKVIEEKDDMLKISLTLDFEVRSLEDLLAACDVDTTKWEVLSWQCKKWDLGIKNNENKIETKQLFSVSAKFSKRTIDKDISLQKDVILKELYTKSPDIEYSFKENSGNNLLELALFDIHFGKLAHREECGEDYDLKIAAERYKTAISELLSRVNLKDISKILLPIGNDMINVDNIQGTTTAGTPQDTDSRFYKIVRTVKNLLIDTINNLCKIAPVDVVVAVGNHDEQTSFMIGEMLDAYYHNNKLVTVNNTAAPRKYYSWGKTSIMFTHGNKEKHADLGMIFAAENPKLWANTTQRFIQLGHFHSNKKINYLSNQEVQGFQIQIIPSLSGSDAWHKGKGYMALKQAKAFLFNKDKGLIGEFTYTNV